MKKNLNFFILLAFVLLMAAPLKAEEAKEANDLEDESQFEDIEDTSLDIQGRSLRGNLWEYDKGPEKNSDFLKIFTSLPNYRAIGRSVIGEERYRWHWGPVFYRGRLGENEVKILVIGQEGAQDEALARHTFTGGTGTHMQALLNFLGVNRSYLFVNTFIYSIRGQYQDKKLPGAIEGDLWMAQDLQSPIVQTRHRLLNEILKRNQESLKVIVAVGGGAKDTLQTWIKSKGGVCRQAGVVESCDSSVLKEDLVVMGVAHPGMSGQAKNDAERKQILDMLRGSFQKASNPILLPGLSECQFKKLLTESPQNFLKTPSGSLLMKKHGDLRLWKDKQKMEKPMLRLKNLINITALLFPIEILRLEPTLD